MEKNYSSQQTLPPLLPDPHRIGKIPIRQIGYAHALGDQALVSGTNFLLGLALARLLGIENFGVYSILWLIYLFFAELQRAYIISPMMTLGAKKQTQSTLTYYNSVLLLQLVFSLCSGALAFSICWLGQIIFKNSQIELFAPVFALMILIRQCQEFLRRYLMIHNQWQTVWCLDTLAYGGVLIAVGSGFYWGILGVAYVLWMITACSLMGSFVGFAFFNWQAWNLAVIIQTAKHHWIFGRWLLATAVVQWSSGNYLILSAGAILGSSAVGIIKACQNLLGVLNILFLATESIVPAKAARIHNQQGNIGLKIFLKKIYVYLLGACVFMCLVIGAGAGFWLELVFGDSYAQFDTILIALCLLTCLLPSNVVLQYALRSIEHTRPLFFGYLITASLSLLLSDLIVSIGGLLAIILALMLFQIITQTWYIMVLKKNGI